MQTMRFDSQPVCNSRSYDSPDTAGISGYPVTNALSVTVRYPDPLGAMFDAVARAGANGFRGIGFGLQDPDPLTDKTGLC